MASTIGPALGVVRGAGSKFPGEEMIFEFRAIRQEDYDLSFAFPLMQQYTVLSVISRYNWMSAEK